MCADFNQVNFMLHNWWHYRSWVILRCWKTHWRKATQTQRTCLESWVALKPDCESWSKQSYLCTKKQRTWGGDKKVSLTCNYCYTIT